MIPPIQNITAREILDSRGIPTLEVDILLEGGAKGRASVPSGASTGQFEATELRDAHRPDRFMGKGVLTAMANVEDIIAPALQGKAFETQEALDQRLCQLDGTDNKSHLGANGILSVSLAYARAQSAYRNVPLYQSLNALGCSAPRMPVPMMNVINGGAHADNPLSVQEFMIIPYGFPRYNEALRAGVEIFYALKSRLKQMGLSVNVGDEGGFAPALPGTQKTLDIVLEAIHQAGYQAGSQVALGLDVAASTLFTQGRYHFPEEGLILTPEELVRFYEQLVRSYPLLSLEDGMEETDFDGWTLLTQALGDSVQLVGDDVFVTNPKLFQEGINQSIANAILVKVNQIGTLTEALTTITMAKEAGYGAIISHRSGETEDTFIADLAVASGVGQIKTGSLSRSDRVAKYNQLLRIEEQSALPYAGAKAFAPSLIERFLP